MTADPPLDYERLMADYATGLVETLRGFGPAAEYLELWVPDEDLIRSLCNMADAAAAARRERLSVFLGSAVAAGLDGDKLVRAASAYGDARVVPRDGGLLFTLDGLGAPRAKARAARPRRRGGRRERGAEALPALSVAGESGLCPHYRAAVDRAGAAIAREGSLPAAGLGETAVTGESGGARLHLLVGAERVIHAACHEGVQGRDQRAVLDAFCGLIEGHPIQEASDHGVIRLEAALRDHAMGRPVPGIVSPEAADPVFRLPVLLVRAALARYRERTGYIHIANRFDVRPGPAWRALDDAGRRRRLAEALGGGAVSLGAEAGEVEVVAVEHDVRVVVRLKGRLAAGDKQHHMMVLERALKQGIDGRLELFQEELKDVNRIRRLSGTGEEP